jgi:hypothetical protein
MMDLKLKGLNNFVISLRRTDFAFHFKICVAMHSIQSLGVPGTNVTGI